MYVHVLLQHATDTFLEISNQRAFGPQSLVTASESLQQKTRSNWLLTMEVRIQLTPLYRSPLTFSLHTLLVSNDVIPKVIHICWTNSIRKTIVYIMKLLEIPRSYITTTIDKLVIKKNTSLTQLLAYLIESRSDSVT